jgi:hypothetical protein
LKLAALGVALGLLASACTGGGGSDGTPARRGSNVGSPMAGTAPPAQTIHQPVVEGLPLAPESHRVDLVVPTFSNPTEVTNPLFPVSMQESVLLLGRVDGQPFRTEVTLLPDTRIIEWQGQRVETLVSQYVAYLDGRLHEVAYDHYAQADDGSVWYFGEDVFNFSDGAIVDTHGTWFAGKDGPAAMIMPAEPHVGDVYRPENIPGLVFEEVTVKSVDQSLDGPLGPLEGGMLIEELHMDGATEDKSFARGYGEFYTAGGGDVEAVAMAVPANAVTEPLPKALATLETGAGRVFAAAGSKDWKIATTTVGDMVAAWENYAAGEVPQMIRPRMTAALDTLADAVVGRNTMQARQAAIDSARWTLDLQLRHRPVTDIDLARFDLWAAQLLVDVAGQDAAAVNGDLFALDYIRDRILQALPGDDATRLNSQLEELQGAVGDEDLDAAAEAAATLRDVVTGLDSES